VGTGFAATVDVERRDEAQPRKTNDLVDES
jgi:hypothetical protein